MEFLVRIEVDLPGDLPDAQRESLLSAELKRGQELVASGKIKAIWRIPGGLRNVGIWDITDATELQQLLESLPVYRWLSADVVPLAQHPLNRH